MTLSTALMASRKPLFYNKIERESALNASRYGFNGKEKDNEIKGNGNSYSFTFRIYDPRFGRFLSVDPIAASFPWLSPYQFAGDNPILNLDIEGLEPHSVHKVKMRTKPRISNDFTGRTLFDKLIGNDSRGKYTTNINNHNNTVPKPQPNDEVAGDNPNKTKKREKDKPVDNTNPLERSSIHGEDQAIDNRQEYIPKYNEGTLKVDFNQAKDTDGNVVERTIEIGVVDKEGKEKVLNKITTKEAGSVSCDFKLGEGETLFKRQYESGEGTTIMSATKKTEVKKE